MYLTVFRVLFFLLGLSTVFVIGFPDRAGVAHWSVNSATHLMLIVIIGGLIAILAYQTRFNAVRKALGIAYCVVAVAVLLFFGQESSSYTPGEKPLFDFMAMLALGLFAVSGAFMMISAAFNDWRAALRLPPKARIAPERA